MAIVCCAVAMAQEPAVSGDVNGDGECNLNDITALYNYILNDDASGMVNGDQDGDGVITVCDITWVYNILLFVIHDEHDYIDLGLPSGTLWATTNIGANSPEDYGDYFAWGETTPKDVYNWSTYQWCMGSNNTIIKYCIYGWEDYGYNGFFDDKFGLDPEDDAATANWGPEWRMPSRGQIEELRNNCTTEWTSRNGVNGRLFTSNINGASLFLPAAGYRRDGELNGDGNGNYWTLELGTSGADIGCFLGFSGSHMGCYNHNRCNGLTVRAVRVPQN